MGVETVAGNNVQHMDIHQKMDALRVLRDRLGELQRGEVEGDAQEIESEALNIIKSIQLSDAYQNAARIALEITFLKIKSDVTFAERLNNKPDNRLGLVALFNRVAGIYKAEQEQIFGIHIPSPKIILTEGENNDDAGCGAYYKDKPSTYSISIHNVLSGKCSVADGLAALLHEQTHVLQSILAHNFHNGSAQHQIELCEEDTLAYMMLQQDAYFPKLLSLRIYSLQPCEAEAHQVTEKAQAFFRGLGGNEKAPALGA